MTGTVAMKLMFMTGMLYLDGKKLVEVIQAALDNNMMVSDMKKLLIKENPGHEVTFKVV